MNIIKEKIINIIKEEKPQSIEELISFSTIRLQKSEYEMSKIILDLIDEDKISLRNPYNKIQFNDYLFSIDTSWFWLLLTSIIIYFITIMASNYSRIIVFRYIFGGLFTLFLPGYSLMRALFKSSQIGDVERIALGIGLSLGISPTISFLLNFTPWGISLYPVTISISLFTLFSASIGLYRDYYEKNFNITSTEKV